MTKTLKEKIITLDLRNFMATLQELGAIQEKIEESKAKLVFNAHKVPRELIGINYKQVAKKALDKVKKYNQLNPNEPFDINLCEKGYKRLLESVIIYI